MVPTTDTPNATSAPAEFYDHLAGEYDGMTGFADRFEREEPVFRDIVNAHNLRTALDAGCGTGFHSLLLARLGVAVTAIDVSTKMVQRTQQHAAGMGLPVTVVQSDVLHVADGIHAPFDAVFVLGNTLPHLTSDGEVDRALGNFRSMLAPGGLLVLQTLNYDTVLAGRNRIISVKETGGSTYVRFYDFGAGTLTFNVLVLKRTASGLSHTLHSTLVRPLTSAFIMDALGRAGFVSTKRFGSLGRDPFTPSSRDHVVFAYAPAGA